MPYDPDEDLYTAEPKLLSLDFSCFPVFYAPPAPPDYDLIMASNTCYHRVGEARPSMESSADLDEGLLLLDPLGSDDGNEPPKEQHKFTYHPTLFLRLIAICLLIPAFVLFILSNRPRNLSATIFAMIAIIRNVLVLLHHCLSRQLKIKFSIELRNRRSRRNGKSTRKCPDWLKQVLTVGPLHFLVDLFLCVLLLICNIIATSGAVGWHWGRYGGHPNYTISGCILTYIAFGFYLSSIFDMGKPSNVTISSSISFNFEKEKKPQRPEQPQVYRDIEDAAGLGERLRQPSHQPPMQSRKSGTDSPVIV
ncbi:hypothetical protein BDZ45DRAFT_725043 [Acephala macrosclerotiorum]|nr:hypothetical protein BDZ45DRAFT_725043 [Acephala macrosclerotiorum]